jgi:D-alanyl-D-alanine carboxypeptidase/D-alanyl-D-alanine-endopeptidase (penicillin-binding protein 4)
MRIILLVLTAISLLASAPLDSLLQSQLKRFGYSSKSVGFILKDPSGKVVASINDTTPYILASVQKLFTGSAAFDRLTSSHSFKTNIYLDSLNLVSGEVIGNLSIKGHGDPGFTAERVWLLATHLKHRGIKKISDTIFLDNSYFDTISVGPGFNNKNSSRAYMAPISPISTNFNAVAVHILPTKAGHPANISLFPDRVNSQIKGGVNTVGKGVQSGFQVSTSFNGSRTVVHASGTVKEGGKSKYTYRKVWDPAENFGATFIAACREVGIECSAVVKEKKVVNANSLFYSFDSEPLNKQIKSMFKYSNNFIAEMIFKTLNAEVTGKTGSWSGGVKTIKEWVKIIDPQFGDFEIVNGSGMSPLNKATPKQIESILNYSANQNSWSPEFFSALPIAGVDGTLKTRFKGSNLTGILRAKTGTLQNYGVSNLAGFVFTPQGRYSFVLLINDKSKGLTSHWELQEVLLGRLFDEL